MLLFLPDVRSSCSSICCDCLYAERKDRSILFWKSLPVSDAATVLSKLLVALIVVPLGVYVLALVTNLLALLMFKVPSISAVERPFECGPASRRGSRSNGYLLVDVFVLALWYSPIAAYQLLISGWCRAQRVRLDVLPPVALILGRSSSSIAGASRSFIGIAPRRLPSALTNVMSRQ